MTEGQWRSSNDPQAMLAFLRPRLTSPRKPRLFACSCCRRIWHTLKAPRVRAVVEVVERFADGQATLQEWREAVWEISNGDHPAAQAVIQADALTAALRTASASAQRGGICAEWSGSSYSAGHFAEVVAQAALVRDLFDNPFRPSVMKQSWLDWDHGLVVRLAETIYEERAFERMPYLGDALEEAGCDDADMLSHCRQEMPHARGCWLVDLVLARS